MVQITTLIFYTFSESCQQHPMNNTDLVPVSFCVTSHFLLETIHRCLRVPPRYWHKKKLTDSVTRGGICLKLEKCSYMMHPLPKQGVWYFQLRYFPPWTPQVNLNRIERWAKEKKGRGGDFRSNNISMNNKEKEKEDPTFKQKKTWTAWITVRILHTFSNLQLQKKHVSWWIGTITSHWHKTIVTVNFNFSNFQQQEATCMQLPTTITFLLTFMSPCLSVEVNVIH